MKTLWIAIRLFLVMTLLTGVAYPLLVTGASQVLFPYEANGSLILSSPRGNEGAKQAPAIGSELLGQNFKDQKYFWSRPSAVDYNPLPSGGSNLGPTSAELLAKFNERKQNLEKASFQSGNTAIPEDLLFASSSGLDPHISPAAAYYQINRVASIRGLTNTQKQELKSLIDTMTEDRSFGILGEKRVNVLKLNMELEKKFPKPSTTKTLADT